MSRTIRLFLICSGFLFLAIEFFRLYMHYRLWASAGSNSQHLMLALLSILISAYIFKIGAVGHDLLKRDAIFLVSSGAVLALIWSYRLFLILDIIKTPLIRKRLTYVSITYIILSLLIIVTGLKIRKGLKLKHD
mgnify:CR=1 FL=1